MIPATASFSSSAGTVVSFSLATYAPNPHPHPFPSGGCHSVQSLSGFLSATRNSHMSLCLSSSLSHDADSYGSVRPGGVDIYNKVSLPSWISCLSTPEAFLIFLCLERLSWMKKAGGACKRRSCWTLIGLKNYCKSMLTFSGFSSETCAWPWSSQAATLQGPGTEAHTSLYTFTSSEAGVSPLLPITCLKGWHDVVNNLSDRHV